MLVVLASCEKNEPKPDIQMNWILEAQSDVRLTYITFSGDRISLETFSKGESKVIKKWGDINTPYDKIEIECLTSSCSYTINSAPYTQTKVFTK